MIRGYIQRLGQRNPECVFEKIDPRCKFIVMVLVSSAVVAANSAAVIVPFVASGLLALSARLFKIFILSTLFAVIAWVLLIVVSGFLLNADVGDKWVLFEGIVFRGVPLVIISFWFAVTTKLNDLTCALEAWKVPSTITLPLTVAARFIPTLFYESKIIKDCMKQRGILRHSSDVIIHPRRIWQSYLAVVIIRSLKMADELAAVAETRGLGRPGIRYHYRLPRFKTTDYVTMTITAIVLIIMAGVGYTWR